VPPWPGIDRPSSASRSAQSRNAPGRPRPDVKDCIGSSGLHSLGLLSAAFRPRSRSACCARTAAPHSLVEDQSRFILRMQKALSAENVKLTETGQRRHRGDRDGHPQGHPGGRARPHKLAQLRQPGCKQPQAQFAGPWKGPGRRNTCFALKQSLELYEYSEADAACDRRSRGSSRCWRVRRSPGRSTAEQAAAQPPQERAALRGGSLLYEMAGVDLTAIEGIRRQHGVRGAQRESHGHEPLAQRAGAGGVAGLAPNRGRRGVSSRVRRPSGGDRGGQALRVVAADAAQEQERPGGLLPARAGRRGAPKAITDAYKVAASIYAMLKHGQEYSQGVRWRATRRRTRSGWCGTLKKKAAELGFELKEKAEPAGDEPG